MNRKQRILVADDETDISTVFASALTMSNYEVELASDGEECLQKARSGNFDLIVLDVHMPKIDGFEAIRQIKSMNHLRYTPVVFLTGFGTSPEDIESGYTLGGTEYWKKPITVEELEVRVRSILSIAEAERKLRALQETFTSMVIHDLRGPLGGIVGFAELLLEDKEQFSAQHLEMLNAINSASHLMLDIVTDFLEITRLEMGELKLHRSPTNIGELIDRCVFNAAEIQKEKSIHTKTEIGDIPLLSCDPDRIEEVINHLLDNALRFTPPDGSITVTAKKQDSFIVVKVSDTGKGIPEEDIPMLFDKMRITTLGAKRAGSKTGLGLPICKGIVEAHRGKIMVTSKEGNGTTVTVMLPIVAV
jgi:two-component system, sensor histidine kinase and response regulator